MSPKYKMPVYSDALLACCIGIVTIVLPSIVSDELMNGTQSGKFFFFTYSLMGILFLGSVGLLFKRDFRIKVSILDVLLFLFVGWVSFNKYILHDVHAFSLRYYELLGLSVLYIIIRTLNTRYSTFLLLAICIGGTVQAVYGNLQLWGYYPSHHGLFKMTGSFFNPGPYAGYLCCILPIALGLYWHVNHNVNINHKGHKEHEEIKSIKYQVSGIKTWVGSLNQSLAEMGVVKFATSNLLPAIIKYLSLIAIVSILLVLPAARSRAAWLGAIAGVAYLAWHKYNLKQFFKRRSHQTLKLFKRAIIIRNRTIVAALALVLLAGSFGLYHYKKDSADGRMLIWTVTANIIKDYPLRGVGQDLFKAHYMNYQADYFRNHPNSKYETVADDNQYAFNEFLNTWSENGLIGFLLFAGIIGMVFLSLINHEGHKEHKGKNEVGEVQPAISNLQFVPILKAAILSLLVFGMFAYPSEILPIKIVDTVCLAILSGMVVPLFKHEGIFLKKTSCSSHLLWLKLPIITATVVSLVWILPEVKIMKNAYESWKDASELYSYRMYIDCLDDYKKTYPRLQHNGEFLINYGKALSMAEKYVNARNILQEAKKYQSNSILYIAFGNSQRAMNDYDNVEKNYIKASEMTPCKFYPQYLLAKFYEETNQINAALKQATSLVNKEIKNESTAIEEIHDEMEKIIRNRKKGNKP